MHNRTKQISSIIILSILAGVCLASCGLTYQFLTKQCILWTCAPSRKFTIYDLILPAEYYPENAIINPMVSSPESPGIKSGTINIYWEDNGQLYKSIMTVNRFGTEDRAKNYYSIVNDHRARGSYYSHPDIVYRSEIADNYEIGCGFPSLGGEYECDIDVRYEEFVVSLNASITEQMTESVFEDIVISLDKQFETYLSN